MPRKIVLHAAAILAAVPRGVLAQAQHVDPGTTGPAWSPYLVGALIGVLSMLTFYFSGTLQLAVGSWIALIGFFVGGVATAMLLFYV